MGVHTPPDRCYGAPMNRGPSIARVFAVAGIVGCSVQTLSSETSPSAPPTAEPDVVADLRADANRDGDIRFDDDSDATKLVWDRMNGAIFLANIDDDAARCKLTESDQTIATCNDAEDEVVNGEDDALDLARLRTRPWPKAPDDAVAQLTIVTESARSKVRLFRRVGTGAADFEVWTEESTLDAATLREGVEFGIEAKDIVRDREAWDGFVEVALSVTSPSKGSASDTVKLRVAPVLTFHHLLPAERIWASKTGSPVHAAMRDDLAKSCAAERVETRWIDDPDPWTQDFFEPGFMAMPSAGGGQHVMRVNYRSANVVEPTNKKKPLRPAGRVVFELRGPDVAAIQQFDVAHSPRMDTLNSFGNFETIPPHDKDGASYPFGRVLRGSTRSYYPDKTFTTLIDSQAQQPAVAIDTSWLLVGHVDETLSFVKAPTPRGWVLLANDARLARKMLEGAVKAGHGKVPMFVGKSWVDAETDETRPAEATIAEVLADSVVMQASAEAAAEVDAQVAVLKREIGLSDDEVVYVPFLHTLIEGKSIAYQPALVNGVYVSETRFVAPDPHGPIINDQDIFKAAMSEALGKLGIKVDFAEDWDGYHVALGEVHCGSNATRKIPETRWWESGR